MKTNDDEGYVIRVRGLPWSATEDDVRNFFEEASCEIAENGIHFTYVRDGRPSGECYIEFTNEDSLNKALTKDKEHLGKRYVEIFKSKRQEMEWVVKRSGLSGQQGADAVVRLRGLPFGCSKEEIAHFFSGLEIVPNGITLLHDGQGRSTGDGYVQFASASLAEQALSKHTETIGHRYIEIFKSSLVELRSVLNSHNRRTQPGFRPGPYDRNERYPGYGGGRGGGGGRRNVRGFNEEYDDYYEYPPRSRRQPGGGYGGGRNKNYYNNRSGSGDYTSSTGHSVHMRGLPFSATEEDIIHFFRPSQPIKITIHYNADGRASGEADVDFATHHEAEESLRKDRAAMQHRYIELFLKSTPGGRSQHNPPYSGDHHSGVGPMQNFAASNQVGTMGNPNYTPF